MFSRPNGDIQKMLAKIPKLPTLTVIDRIRRASGINEARYDLSDKERLHN